MRITGCTRWPCSCLCLCDIFRVHWCHSTCQSSPSLRLNGILLSICTSLCLFICQGPVLLLPVGSYAQCCHEFCVKRSLKMDDQLEENSFGPSKITRKRSITTYSPTTGTRQMSPFSSPTSSKKQKHRNRPSNEKRKQLDHLSVAERKECPPQDDEFMVVFSKVEKYLEETVEIMRNLRSVQALEGNKKLENLMGTSCTSRFLKREVKKTKELLAKVTKQKLFEKKNSGLPHKELCHLDSYRFLKAILNQGT
ncbi:centromere protein R isoform X2 [Fukomys damarensis]|nr:centromere protein R isoform X2 [Fukomys damarensis]XP_010603367.1 centromere protein R isoform X2 [Fukomys damarensis]